MAFKHYADVTDPIAPDEVVDWFEKFQTWITSQVGWTVASGGGTTNLVITSGGEAGGLTKLYVHIWRDGGNPDQVHLEVQDDAGGTHATNEGGYVDSGGAQFAFWMSADKDAIAIVWKAGAGYRLVYGGLVMPFALTTTDETYRMIAIVHVKAGSILRRYDDVWDQDDVLWEHGKIYQAVPDRLDADAIAIGGVYFGDNDTIAGQLKHLSCRISAAAINPEDEIATGQPGATTTWKVFSDGIYKFAMRTGGVLPTGYPDGAHFSHTSGAAADQEDFITALKNHMVSVGWTATDYSGTSGRDFDWFFYSQGESGNEDIYLRVSVWGVSKWIYQCVTDGIPGAHSTTEHHANVVAGDFPTQYYISADRDCLTYTINDGGFYMPVWMGLLIPFAPGLPDSTYRVCCISYTTFSTANARILRAHDGTWNDAISQDYQADGNHIFNSQPNLYDASTYLVWPHTVYETIAAGQYEMLGMCRYFFFTHGGGIASLDTITVGSQKYTVFFPDGVNNNRFALRTQ